MKRTAAAVLALLFAACNGGTDGTTTTGGSSTSLGSTTSSVAGSTTTTGGTESTLSPQGTVPPVIAQVAFAFASGDDPRVLVEVSVGESPDGPWLPAGFSDETPTLTGSSYWVRFDITNTDQLNAVLTDLDISGFDAGSFLGEDICELEEPLPRDGQTVCVIGEFPVQPGGNQADFVVGGFGERQGGPDRWYDPPIPTSLEFDGARHSFALVFGTEEGLRIDGTADASEVQVDDFGVSGSVRLDCSGGNPFEGEPALEAYVIANFSADGSLEESCPNIPTGNLEFFPDFDGDNAYLYFGAEGTDTTTSATTTTISGFTTTTISG